MKDGTRRALGLAKRVLGRKGALAGVLFLATVVLIAIFARWIIPYDPIAQDLVSSLEPPGRSTGSAPTSSAATSWPASPTAPAPRS